MKDPLVTVIIPSFNHARYIKVAIESVLSQTYPAIELIVVDDGSVDGSPDIIRDYERQGKLRCIINRENRGQSFSINRALALASGEFVSFLPSDDWYLPKKTELQVEKFQSCGPEVGVVYAAGLRFYEDTGETLRVELPVHTGWVADKIVIGGNFIYPVTPMFRREVFRRHPFNPEFKAEGEAIYTRIALTHKFEYIEDIVAVMRDHSYNIGKDAMVMHSELVRYWTWFFSLPDVPASLQKLRPQVVSRVHRVKAMQLVYDKKLFSLSRQALLSGVACQPTSVINFRFWVTLAITLMPSFIARRLVDAIQSRKNRAVRSRVATL